MKRILSAIILICVFGFSSPAGADVASLAPAGAGAPGSQASAPADAVNAAGKDGYGVDCAPGQELSYDARGVYCTSEAELQDGGIPNCGDGQVLTGRGGRLVCITPAVASGMLCGVAVRRAVSGYASLAKCRGQAIVMETGPNSWSAPNCPKGYALQEFDVSGTGIVGLLTCSKD